MSARKHSSSFAMHCKVNRSLKGEIVKAPFFPSCDVRGLLPLNNRWSYYIGYIFPLLCNISNNQIYIANGCQGRGVRLL